MIGIIADSILGYIARSLMAGPCAILTGITAVFAICGCVRCMRCRLRDCGCCKRFLRLTGHDQFDDFELMMLVHEATFEKTAAKMSTVVRVTAGVHRVKTDPNSNGIFQQPLHITVEQGTEIIQVELLDSGKNVLSVLNLRTADEVLRLQKHEPEQMYHMTPVRKGVRSPRIKLTMVVEKSGDAEQGLLHGTTTDTDDLVRLQLEKAKSTGHGLSEMQILAEASSGPLELFEGLGKTTNVWVSIVAPPTSRRHMLAIWHSKHDVDRHKPIVEIDLLRVQSIQADPTRHHVFVVNYYDASRVRQSRTFRRTDRARDVWVDILHLLVQKVHDKRREKQERRGQSPSPPSATS